ncbi:VC0807 family protein [Nocardioides rubriscoriae]|uniref:VC0807 family protein n=1 Tax=Nocardioides rubriscoriae TaxID=642762 RepID=UPI0011E03CC3|nr:VC0807 family protein [Nocardioides rubriscoriae]
MSILALPAPVSAVPVSPAVCPHRAALAGVLRTVGLSLLVACGVPAVLFYAVLETAGLGPAILSALAWSYGALAWRRVTGRPTSGLLVLTVTILTIRTVFTLSTGNTYVYFLQPIISDAVVAAVFLTSLVSARPLVARLAADFYPMSPDLAAHPRVRRLFSRLTTFWGAVCLVKAALGLWLLESLSIGSFVLVKNSAVLGLTAAAVAVTIWCSLVVLRHVSAPSTP